MEDEFRVEVELRDEAHGYSLGERLRALDLDDEARKRLGKRVLVTRDGSRLFLYASTEEQAREAADVVRQLVDDEGLTAEIETTRWHPIAEEWKDVSIPLPRTAEEEQAEYAEHEAAEIREAAIEGEYDWHVAIRAKGRDEAREVAARLGAEGYGVHRRWRYVLVDAPTEERAQELAERLRGELPEDSEVSVEVNPADIELPTFQFLPF
jgi:hypothetical protein